MSMWKKMEKSEPEKPREATKAAPGAGAAPAPGKQVPQIYSISPLAAIPGGELTVRGSGLTDNGHRPHVRFGDLPGNVLLSSTNRLIVRVPESVAAPNLTVETRRGVSEPTNVVVGKTIAENLHPVANPVVDAEGNVYATFSGTRGQKVSTSVFKIDVNRVMHAYLTEILNATGLAFDREGNLYISSRSEGNIYRVTPGGERSTYAQGMGVATGIAFDHDGNLYVGDRTGTIFKIGPDRQIFVFATVEPSVAAYHMAFGPAGDLFLTGPTTSSFDHVLRISPAGEVSSFYRGLGRPQGLAFDAAGNLYVTASLAGTRGVVRLTPDAHAELVISGYDLVGLAFAPRGALILATNSSLVELPLGIEGFPLIR